MENSSAKIRNASPVNQNSNKKKSLSTHLLAGGGAGFMEAMTCHPLDTIKVRMQLSASARVELYIFCYKFYKFLEKLC